MTTPPPIPTRKSRIVTVAVPAAVIIIICISAYYFYTYDPAASIGAPKCTFKLLTGWDCPGCGSQRAAHAILHGHWADAWDLNPFIFFAVPVALYYGIVEAGRAHWPRLHARSIHPAILTAILVAIIAWWILRNL